METQGRKITNQELAAIFERIANLMEIKGEMVFKVRAYQRVAENLRAEAREAVALLAEGKLSEIPGVGKAIAEKIEEIVTTGKLSFLEKLEEEVPPSLLELIEVPDVGPKRAAMLWKQAGILNLAGLESAAREHKLRLLPGLGDKSEARILAGIEALARRTDRMLLDQAWSRANGWLHWLLQQPEVLRAEHAGSLRRWRDTIGDLDLVIATHMPQVLMDRFTSHPDVIQVKGRGENKSSVEFQGGLMVQVWAQPPQRFGALWIYATGSKAHNVRLRELALQRGLSLSERGLEDQSGQLIEYSSEEEIYSTLGLPWIPPELREDRGEIEAALQNNLPNLIEPSHIISELHSHSTWSDGALPIAAMAQAAIDRGLKVLAITDHSGTLGITGGLKVDQLTAQREEIDRVQNEIGDRLKLLHGIEVDIMADGTLGFPDEALAKLDIVIASIHSSLRQPREVITNRLVQAIRNPHVDLVAHPGGRLLPHREGADLDWEVILREAHLHGIALEINASPSRLDLTDIYARHALKLGIPLSINTDAHSPTDFDQVKYGIAVARRAWAEPNQVINTWPIEKITGWLSNRD